MVIVRLLLFLIDPSEIPTWKYDVEKAPCPVEFSQGQQQAFRPHKLYSIEGLQLTMKGARTCFGIAVVDKVTAR